MEDAVAALRADGGESELLTLLLPWGLPPVQRAGMLRAVGELAEALRGRGIDAHVNRISGRELKRRGLEGDAVEALFVLYAGSEPALPPVVE